jgi:putative flippase GtrA
VTVIRYLIVGGSSALIEGIMFYLLYTRLHLNLFVANCLGIAVILVYGFVFQKTWTFRNGEPPGRQILLFTFQVFVAIILNNMLIYLFIKKLDWPPGLSKTVQVALVFFWNYGFCRWIVFPETERKSGGSRRAVKERAD